MPIPNPSLLSDGPPPRIRGARRRDRRSRAYRRTTPAHTGSTSARTDSRHTRRTTPAHTGSTRGTGRWPGPGADHPRAYGEHMYDTGAAAGKGGPPPRIRGARRRDQLRPERIRTTPAHTGSTLRDLLVSGRDRVTAVSSGLAAALTILLHETWNQVWPGLRSQRLGWPTNGCNRRDGCAGCRAVTTFHAARESRRAGVGIADQATSKPARTVSQADSSSSRPELRKHLRCTVRPVGGLFAIDDGAGSRSDRVGPPGR